MGPQRSTVWARGGLPQIRQTSKSRCCSSASQCKSTGKAVLGKTGMQHLSPVVIPMLNAKHRDQRVKLTQKFLRRDITSKHIILITDSKVSLLRKSARACRRWRYHTARGTIPTFNKSIAA